MIGKENIEEKIFEYFEGDLSSSEMRDLESFIQANPEYQEDFDAWKNSSVQDQPMEYKHMEDLLVEEKSSPKGWFRWASGGALMMLFAFASIGLYQKMGTENTQVAQLEEDLKENKAALGSASKDVKTETTTNTSETTVNGTNRGSSVSEGLAGEKEVAESAVLADKSVTPLVPVKVKSSEELVPTKIAAKYNNPVAENNKDLLLGDFIAIDHKGIDYGALRAAIAENINKVRFVYEDPNQKKEYGVFSNSKDPYLNYTLAHTIEENASFAGNSDGIRAEHLYRTEWPDATKENFTSHIFSLDGYSKLLKGGVGVLLNYDKIGHGKLASFSGSVLYSPKFLVKGISFEPSVKYTYNTKSFAWGQIENNDIKDPRNGVKYASVAIIPEDITSSEIAYHDFGLGFMVNANQFYAGFQVDHVNNPTYMVDGVFDQEITIPTKYSAMAGTEFKPSKKSNYSFSPAVNYVKYGAYNALWGNMQAKYKGMFLAAGAATNKDMMFSLGYVNPYVRLVYGFGVQHPSVISGLSTDDWYNSHQLSLRLNLKPKK